MKTLKKNKGWPIRYEPEMKQFFFLKGVLSKDPCDPVTLLYEETIRIGSEKNWENDMFGL